ncbi:hypothetical protein NC651_004337 [Populus alba x Populus x berolinensis]|nr:hypothetical protein NC651_004337 [Populus alba x Populus x berolinensis]
MSCIWKVLPLSNLTILVVRNCKRLRYIFTDIMIANLVQLKVLKISTCKDLEQIIAKNNDDEKNQILSGSDLQSLCFPKLCRLEIRRCNKLKSLFLVAMTSGLPKLQILKDDHASPVNVEKKMVLPYLQKLSLKELPSIVCFSLGCHDFLFPCLEKLEVYECPKLTTKFAIRANGSMSAQSEVSQVDDDSRTGFFVPTTTCRMWTRNNGWGEEEEWEDEDEEAEEWEDEDEEAEEWEVEEEEDEDGGGHDD